MIAGRLTVMVLGCEEEPEKLPLATNVAVTKSAPTGKLTDATAVPALSGAEVKVTGVLLPDVV